MVTLKMHKITLFITALFIISASVLFYFRTGNGTRPTSSPQDNSREFGGATSKFNAHAKDELDQIANDQRFAFCAKTAQLAEILITRRENNEDIESIINTIRSSPKLDSETKRRTVSMAISAYDEPLYVADDMKDHVIKDFKNKIYVDCLSDVDKYK